MLSYFCCMRKIHYIQTKDINLFKDKILRWGHNNYKKIVHLDSNNYNQNTESTYRKNQFESLTAIGALKELSYSNTDNFNELLTFHNKNKDWLFGYLGYDLKNELENLNSENIDELEFPELHFFVPALLFIQKADNIELHYREEDYDIENIEILINKIEATEIDQPELNSIKVESRFTKDEYIETVNKLKNHIQLGDIYEVNFCQEFYATNRLNPIDTYKNLKQVSPTPFSCFYDQLHEAPGPFRPSVPLHVLFA